MRKYLLMLALSFIAVCAMGQTDSLSKEDKRLLDSMFQNDAFINMFMKKDKNYVDVSIGIGNGSFSEYNNAANATGINKQLVYTPTVTYRLKNGFSFAAATFITGDSSGKPEIYQTGLTAGYDYYGKKIRAGATYTRYISNQNKYNSKSLYQNDLYGYVRLANGILQPGITLGYVNGKYKEINYYSFKDSVRIFLPPPPRDSVVTRTLKDSTNNKAQYFSISATVGHDFTFYNAFSKQDELYFTPTLILNMGSDKLSQIHTNRIFNSRLLSKRKKRAVTNKFQMQSVAASFDLTYMYRKFFIEPVLYLDYYLPETTANRFSAVFSVNTGFSF